MDCVYAKTKHKNEFDCHVIAEFCVNNHAVTRVNSLKSFCFTESKNARLMTILQSCIHFIGGSENDHEIKHLTSQEIVFQEHTWKRRTSLSRPKCPKMMINITISKMCSDFGTRNQP